MRQTLFSVCVLLGCSILSSPFAFSTEPSSVQTVPDSITRLQQVQIDSLRHSIARLQNANELQYISTLEKTNQQLSLWFNPYAILIASLSVMFTLLAIAATAIIYRQSKEYKGRLDAFVHGYQAILHKLIEEWNNRRAEIDKQIKDYQTELATATGENKKTIEAEIEKLRVRKDSVGAQIASTVVTMPASGGLYGFQTERYHKCSRIQCGWGFMAKVSPSDFETVFGGPTVTCPKCGNVDRL